MLEDLAITVQQNLISKLPFCAFNGGNDVFVDVGNKSLGLDALMRYLGCYPHEVNREDACLLASWCRGYVTHGCSCAALVTLLQPVQSIPSPLYVFLCALRGADRGCTVQHHFGVPAALVCKHSFRSSIACVTLMRHRV